MKLSIRAVYLACLAACAGGTAQAQTTSVTVYGIAAVEVVHVTNVASATGIGSLNKIDNSQVTTSRLGFKGREVIGGGINAIFGLESGINLDSGTTGTAYWGRGAWVGLESPYGTLTLGRQWNLSDGINGTYFVYGGYSIFRFTEFGFVSDLVNNSVKYVSPSFAGLQVSAFAAPGEGTTGRTWEVGADYKNSGFQVGATHRHAENIAGVADKLSTIGASYPFGTVRVHGGYADANLQGSGFLKARGYDVGIDWAALPAVQVTLDYVGRDQKGTSNDSHFIRLSTEYNMSKRTQIFLNIVGLKNKGTASEHFYGNGAAGRDQNVFSIGLRNLF